MKRKRHKHLSGYKRDVPAATFLLSPVSWRNVKISSTSSSSFSHNLVITMEKVTNTNAYSIIQLKRSYTGFVAKLMLNLWLFCPRINCFLLTPNSRGQQPQYKLAISIAIRKPERIMNQSTQAKTQSHCMTSSCVTVFSESETSHPVGKLLKQAGKKIKNIP